MKQTTVFDRLDNVIGNYMDSKATEYDVIRTASEANKYLIEHPHPHDVITASDLQQKRSAEVAKLKELENIERFIKERKANIRQAIQDIDNTLINQTQIDFDN